MTNNFKFTLVWLIGGTIAVLFSLEFLTGASLGDKYVPMGPDSFYHAQRIVPTVVNTSAFYEYDYDSYVPEGAWVSWPWAYDYMLAMVTRVVMKISGITDPLAVLTYIPVSWVYVNMALLLGIGIALGLRTFHLFVLSMCFAFSYLTQYVHGAGRFDHHFMEYTAVLATLLTTLVWLKKPQSTYRAVFLGMALGLSPGIQNGLFILYFPVILSFFILWIRGKFPRTRSVYILCATILTSTIILLAPSEPFKNFFFTYYLLSWFHLHVAICSIFIILYFKHVNFSRQNILLFIFVFLILAYPLLNNIVSGMGFVTGEMKGLDKISEARSAFGLSSGASLPWKFNWKMYTLLIYLAPISIAWAAYLIYKNKDNTLLTFGVFTIFGLVMLSMQLRLNYYGSFALYLPLLLFINRMRNLTVRKTVIVNTLLISFLLVAYYPGVITLKSERATGLNPGYIFKTKGYEKLANACENEPGVALVPLNDAHMVTYMTSCKVLANNMFINSKQADLRQDVINYYRGTAKSLRENARNIKYVVVTMPPSLLTSSNDEEDEIWNNYLNLNRELLWKVKQFPAGYKLIDEVVLEFTDDNSKLVYMRIFKITHTSTGK